MNQERTFGLEKYLSKNDTTQKIIKRNEKYSQNCGKP
jgi:hypothetical protein